MRYALEEEWALERKLNYKNAVIAVFHFDTRELEPVKLVEMILWGHRYVVSFPDVKHTLVG